MCVCLNARSIINKKSELYNMVEDSYHHIIGITESWAKIDIVDGKGRKGQHIAMKLFGAI